MADRYGTYDTGLEGSARRTERVPATNWASSDYEFNTVPRSIWVEVGNSGGALNIRAIDSTEDCIFNLPAGVLEIPVRPTHIRRTGTTGIQAVIGLS